MRDEVRFTGIASMLSDYECKDGEAEAISGLWQDDAGLKAVALPDAQFCIDNNLTILGVHETSLFRHYILKGTVTGFGECLFWMDSDITGVVTVDAIIGNMINTNNAHVTKISTIGNTIILLCGDGVRYVLWRANAERVTDEYCMHMGQYWYLGDHMPELPIRFSLSGNVVIYPDSQSDAYTDFTTDAAGGISEGNRLAYTNHIKGIMNRLIVEKGHNDGKFIFPFLVRYAYRLYDGSVTMHSAPVLMTPSTKMAPLLLRHLNDYEADGVYLCAAAIACDLQYQVLEDTSVLYPWKDIIQSVDIFITPPIYTYDQSGDNIDNLVAHSANDETGVWVGRPEIGATTYERHYYYQTIKEANPYNLSNWYWVQPPMKGEEQIADEVRDAGDFYLLKSVKTEDITNNLVTLDVPNDYLQSLRQRERMEDDYDSHDGIIADAAFVYNNRVNFAGLQKKRFQGFLLSSSLQYTDIFTETAKTYWELSNQNGEHIVTSGEDTYGKSSLIGAYIYYPFTDCNEAYVQYNGHFYDMKMIPHAMLNGSVYFQGWDSLPSDGTEVTEPTASTDLTESIQDKIYTTEINNPFVVPVTGINTIPGGGRIIGLSSATKALSEGQYGQFPLYALTSNGVWALEVSTTAGYSARNPVSRDVCVGTDSILQTDDAVLFVSDRGIMLLSGSKVECISDKIRGCLVPVDGIPTGRFTGMFDFLRNASMIYDYVGQRVIVYRPNRDYALVYGIRSGQWGGGMLSIKAHVNGWPSGCVVTDASGINVVRKMSADCDSAMPVSGWLLTRPIKLQSGDILKTVRSLIVRGMFRQGHVNVELQGSRNLFDWFPVWASNNHYARGYSGTPWKYYRLLIHTQLAKDESLTGASVSYILKYTNKLR